MSDSIRKLDLGFFNNRRWIHILRHTLSQSSNRWIRQRTTKPRVSPNSTTRWSTRIECVTTRMYRDIIKIIIESVRSLLEAILMLILQDIRYKILSRHNRDVHRSQSLSFQNSLVEIRQTRRAPGERIVFLRQTVDVVCQRGRQHRGRNDINLVRGAFEISTLLVQVVEGRRHQVVAGVKIRSSVLEGFTTVGAEGSRHHTVLCERNCGQGKVFAKVQRREAFWDSHWGKSVGFVGIGGNVTWLSEWGRCDGTVVDGLTATSGSEFLLSTLVTLAFCERFFVALGVGAEWTGFSGTSRVWNKFKKLNKS